MKILFDTCIIIDLLQKRTPFVNDAYLLFQCAANHKIDGYITAKSVADIYYLMHHFTHDDKTTREVLSKLFQIFFILDTTALDCQLAVLSAVGDYEDAVMAETGFRSHMDYIVTRNTQDFIHSAVPVLTPSGFLDLL